MITQRVAVFTVFFLAFSALTLYIIWPTKKKKSLSDFFQTRKSLWVDDDLARFVDLNQNPPAITALTGIMLDKDTSEADIFGEPGSAKYAETLANASTPDQIKQLIKDQWGGTKGPLLVDGRANLFAVIGKDRSLCVVSVRWDACYGGEWGVYCGPLRPHGVRVSDFRVFSN